MAGPHTSAVLLASKSCGTDRLTLVAVSSFMRWDTHDAWPPVRFIAHAIGRSVRQAQKCLRRLESTGELIVRRRKGFSNVYTLGPPLLQLAKRFAAGEKGLWQQMSTSGEEGIHPSTTCGSEDAVHPDHEVEVHVGSVDALHPNSSSTVGNPNTKEVDVFRSKVKQMAGCLADRGIKTSSSDNKRLGELIRAGATLSAIVEAVSECASFPGVSNAFAYGAQTLLNRLNNGAVKQIEPPLSLAEAPWHVVVTKGVELGIGTWNPTTSTEHFPVYKRRVLAAVNQPGTDR